MNSLERLVGILDEFETSDGVLSADALYLKLGYTRSTLYRYLKVLTDAGLLNSLHGVGYTLGSRIAELDYRMRKHDPLVLHFKPHMLDLARLIGGRALLCRRYGDRVLCLHEEAGRDGFGKILERGESLPIYSGSLSLIIFAYLPTAVVRRIFDAHSDAFSAAGFGDEIKAARGKLRQIRDRGHLVLAGSDAPDQLSISVPIFDGKQAILGSLTLLLPGLEHPEDLVMALAERMKALVVLAQPGL